MNHYLVLRGEDVTSVVLAQSTSMVAVWASSCYFISMHIVTCEVAGMQSVTCDWVPLCLWRKLWHCTLHVWTLPSENFSLVTFQVFQWWTCNMILLTSLYVATIVLSQNVSTVFVACALLSVSPLAARKRQKCREVALSNEREVLHCLDAKKYEWNCLIIAWCVIWVEGAWQ